MKTEETSNEDGSEVVPLALDPFSLHQVLILILICLLTVWFLKRKWDLSLLSRLGLDGPQPNFLFGNILELRSDILNKQLEWLQKYGKDCGENGKTMGFYRGPIPVLVTTNLSILKEVFIKDFETFSNRTSPDNDRPSSDLLFLIDQDWKRVRQVLTPIFSSAKLRKMCEVMNRAIKILIEEVDKHVEANEPCNFYRMFQGLTLDVIGETALAMKVDCQRNPDDPLLDTTRKIFQNLIPPTSLLAVTFPCLSRVLRPLHELSTARRIQAKIRNWIHTVIKERKEIPEGSKPVDMLQLMLDAAEGHDSDDVSKTKAVDDSDKVQMSYENRTEVNETAETTKLRKPSSKYMTNREIADNAFLFLLAGYETTSTALSFTVYLLALHQDIQKKLIDEIDIHLAEKKGEPDSDTVAKMEYLDQVLNESMRIYPPIPGLIGRDCKAERVVDGVRIPAGSVVHVPIWNLHHDPIVWPDPWKFDPQRFSVENRKSIKTMAHVPFGEGPRKCIGSRFALLEAKLTLARLLYKYQLVMCEQTEKDIKVTCKGLSLTPVSEKIMLQAVPRKAACTSV